MSSDVRLGTLAEPTRGRDAVHIAIVPVTSNVTVHAGQRMLLVPGYKDQVVPAAPAQAGIGIVDPYFLGPIYPGQRFWLCLMPMSITGLAHVWTHPMFDTPGVTPLLPTAPPAPMPDRVLASEPPSLVPKLSERQAAEAYLRSKANEVGVTYEVLLRAAEVGSDVYMGDREVYLEDDDEFWRNVEIVTGKTFTERHRSGFYFHCAC